MLYACLLPTSTIAAELFKSLNDYIGKLNCTFCVGVCIDRVAAMTRWLFGFTILVKEIGSECESMHCANHEKCWPAKKCCLNLTTFCGI